MAQIPVGRSFVPSRAPLSEAPAALRRMIRKTIDPTPARAPGHLRQPGRSRRSVRNFVPR